MEICKQNCMNTIDEYDFEVETMINHPKNEFDSTTWSTQQLDAIIESAIMKKKALDLTMDLVTNLMKEVDFEEEAAVKAKEEAAQFSIDTLVMMDERKKALLEQQEINSTLLEKVNAEKNVLAIKTEMLYHRVARMLDVGDKSLDVLKRGLDLRLNTALKEKELANEKIQENESALANQTIELNKVVEEYDRLKQETLENSKLQMLLNDRDNVVDKLKLRRGEICDKFQDVNVLKEDLQKEEVERPPNDSCLENLEEHKDCVTEEKVTMSSEGLQSNIEKNDSEENDALNKLHTNQTAAKGINLVLEDDDADIFKLITFVIIFFVISLIIEKSFRGIENLRG